jgi:RNA polymerase sigma factor (sigma-70 family)
MNWVHMTDGELVAAFATDGAEQAFAELVRRHAGMVFRTCRRITGSHQDAEDATQTVFATLVVRGHDLIGCTSLGGWLYSAAWHVSRRYRRSNLTRRQRELRVQPVMPVEGEVRDPDLVDELYRAMQMLPAEYRDAVVLHHLEGCTIQQVAEVMGSSVGTTAARLSRARAMMRERLSWRGVLMTDAMITSLVMGELLREPAAESLATHAAMEGAANGSIDAAAAMAMPATSSGARASVAAAAGSAFRSAVTLYAGLRATQWVAVACVAVVLGAAAAGFTALLQHTKTRVTESASASRSNTSAGLEILEPFPRRSSDTSHVPEPSALGVLVAGGPFLVRRRRQN